MTNTEHSATFVDSVLRVVAKEEIELKIESNEDNTNNLTIEQLLSIQDDSKKQ
jgi:hypothetical protein